MSDRDRQTPGAEVEPCRECGAPLAADQRYCLNCGRRRGEPRLDFRRHVGNEPAASASQSAAGSPQAPAVTAAAEEKGQRDYTPLAAAGGIAVLGLMLLVGVLIGRGDNSASTPTAAPVVRLEGEGGASKDAAADEESTEKGGGLDLNTEAGKSKGGEKATKAPPPEAVASDDELKALEEQSPQEYSESSAKLPNEIATPGEAPPEDNKKPGGGSSGTTIE